MFKLKYFIPIVMSLFFVLGPVVHADTNVAILDSSLSGGIVGISYSQAINASGGTQPLSWNIVDGSLPNGLSLDAPTGIISGTPTSQGSFTFTVRVTDSDGDSATQTLTLPVQQLQFNRYQQLDRSKFSGVANLHTQPLSCSEISGYIAQVKVALYIPLANGNEYYSVYFSRPGAYDSDYSEGQYIIQGDYTFQFTKPFNIASLCTSGVSTIYMNILKRAGSPSIMPEDNEENLYYIINPQIPLSIPVSITTTSLSVATSSLAYTQTLQAVGGTSPYSWNVVDGTLPTGLSLNALTGDISGTPATTGTSNFTVQVTDANSQVATQALSITVASGNHAPTLAPIGNKTVLENQNLSFTLSATDPDSGDTLTYSASNLPSGATFDPATRTFSWTPTYGQAGNYNNVEFTVMDNGSPMMLAFEDITITVGHVNRAPVINAIGPKQVLEHNTLSFTVSATDPDGNAVTLSATGLPTGATFNAATNVFTWTPGYPSAGVYTPTFVATDNGTPVASSSVDVVITVGSNPTPTEQSQSLVNNVVSANLGTSVTNSYLANLNKVGPFIQQGKTGPAINQLNAFINKVNQDYAHGTITLAQKNAFVAQAQALIAALQ